MSRAGDLSNKLRWLLMSYNKANHKAIVETFSETLEDGWEDESIQSFLSSGIGISKEADNEIKKQLSCLGFK